MSRVCPVVQLTLGERVECLSPIPVSLDALRDEAVATLGLDCAIDLFYRDTEQRLHRLEQDDHYLVHAMNIAIQRSDPRAAVVLIELIVARRGSNSQLLAFYEDATLRLVQNNVKRSIDQARENLQTARDREGSLTALESKASDIDDSAQRFQQGASKLSPEPLFAHWKDDLVNVTKVSVLEGCAIGSFGVVFLGSASGAALVTVPLIIAAPSVAFLGIGFTMYGVAKLGQLGYRTVKSITY